MIARPKPDIDEIQKSVRVIVGQGRGRVVEVRAPATPRGTYAGYYNGGTFSQDVFDLSSLETTPNVYWTIQEVDPALLKEDRKNNIYPESKGLTRDENVLRYIWLPIDCDPVRDPKDISSTDTEKAAAFAVAMRVIGYFRTMSIECILADSGNGYHVLVPLDIANVNGTNHLISKVLKAINATFGTEAVKIDEYVFNPSRILKIYGTVARKGPHTDERPWRVSRLIDVPTNLVPLNQERLTALLVDLTEDLPQEKVAEISEIKRYTPPAPGTKITENRNIALASYALHVWYHMTEPNVEELRAKVYQFNQEFLEPPLDESEIDRTVMSSTPKKSQAQPVLCGGVPVGSAPHIGQPAAAVPHAAPTATVSTNAPEKVVEVNDTVQMEDMPKNAIVGGALVDICHDYMSNFPMAYAWPALLTVAGTMVPPPYRDSNESIRASVGMGSQTNLYTALIGPVGSGKSQAIEYAVGNLGLNKDRYTSTKAGSIEGLLYELSKGQPSPQKLVNLDEWSHLFKKAGIDNATFVDILNSGYNNPEFHLTIQGYKQLQVTCALSLLGGIVTEKVQECFNSSSMDGFHDRFLFGICPTINPFQYYPFDLKESAQNDLFSKTDPVQVKILPDVWKLAAQWKKKDPALGRSVEVTVRCAAIIASWDGRTEVGYKDLELMRPFLDYQQTARSIIVPEAGVTADAKMANAILGWLKRHAPNGEWINQRDLKRGIHRILEELGPKIYTSTLYALGRMPAIQTKLMSNPGARDSHLIRLVKDL